MDPSTEQDPLENTQQQSNGNVAKPVQYPEMAYLGACMRSCLNMARAIYTEPTEHPEDSTSDNVQSMTSCLFIEANKHNIRASDKAVKELIHLLKSQKDDEEEL